MCVVCIFTHIYVHIYVYKRKLLRVENWIERCTAKQMKAAVGPRDWLSRRAPCGISTNRKSGFNGDEVGSGEEARRAKVPFTILRLVLFINTS